MGTSGYKGPFFRFEFEPADYLSPCGLQNKTGFRRKKVNKKGKSF